MAKKIRELFVTVTSPSGKSYDAPASALAAINAVGPFSVMPEHENFISLVTKSVTVYDLTGKKYEIPFGTGILEVSNNEVHLFIT